MGRPAPMHLSEDQRIHVQVFLRRGKDNARTLTRARVLLKSDEGWTDAEIAEALYISEQTIRNIRQRFRAGVVEAVLTDKRQERRRQALTDGQAAHLIAISCSTVPLKGKIALNARKKNNHDTSKNLYDATRLSPVHFTSPQGCRWVCPD